MSAMSRSDRVLLPKPQHRLLHERLTVVYDVDVCHVPQVGVVHLDALLAVVAVGQVPPLALRVRVVRHCAGVGAGLGQRQTRLPWRGFREASVLRRMCRQQPARPAAPQARHVLLHNVLFDLTLKKPLRKSCSAKNRTCGGLGEQAHTAELAVDHLGQ